MIAGTETRATAVLATVIRAYPDAARAAFNRYGIAFGTIDPVTVAVEESSKQGRTDVRFEAEDTTVIVEAKIDAPPSREQVERYLDDNTARVSAVLLAPQVALPEATEMLAGVNRAHVLSWEQLLGELEEVTPIARGLACDIADTQAQPATKTKARAAMRAATEAIDARPCHVAVSATQAGRPSIDITVPGTYVFGQIEAPRSAAHRLVFSTAIGLLVDDGDYQDAAKRDLMEQALRKAGALLDHGRIPYNRHSRASENAILLGMDDQPWLARGYQHSYAGVRLPPRASAEEAIRAVIPAAEAYAQGSLEFWPDCG